MMRKVDRIISLARMAGLEVHVHSQPRGQFTVWSNRDLIGCYPNFEAARQHIKQDVKDHLEEMSAKHE